MRIVITGATGFIGSHVAVRLARAGHQVVATGRNPRKVPALAAVPGLTLARLELGDPTSWGPALAGAEHGEGDLHEPRDPGHRREKCRGRQ